jgi:hypothetical protein
MRGLQNVNTEEGTSAYLRPEMASVLYNYDRLNAPAYKVNGVMDYHLESRLLDRRTMELVPDPLLNVPNGNEFLIESTLNVFDAKWLVLSPKVIVGPGERTIWRFDFFDKTYDGVLFVRGPGSFNRQYYFPDAGFGAKSFGVAEGRPKTLGFSNSLSSPQELELSYLRPTDGSAFGEFVRLRIQSYRPSELQVETISLTPYHVRVRSKTPVYLETPRSYVPGYSATVNGNPVEVNRSPDDLVMVPVDSGEQEVVVQFGLTSALKMFGIISLTAWIGALLYLASPFLSQLSARFGKGGYAKRGRTIESSYDKAT